MPKRTRPPGPPQPPQPPPTRQTANSSSAATRSKASDLHIEMATKIQRWWRRHKQEGKRTDSFLQSQHDKFKNSKSIRAYFAALQSGHQFDFDSLSDEELLYLYGKRMREKRKGRGSTIPLHQLEELESKATKRFKLSRLLDDNQLTFDGGIDLCRIRYVFYEAIKAFGIREEIIGAPVVTIKKGNP